MEFICSITSKKPEKKEDLISLLEEEINRTTNDKIKKIGFDVISKLAFLSNHEYKKIQFFSENQN